MRPEVDAIPRARIPADIDLPDRIAYGFTTGQLAVMAVASVLGLGVYRVLGPLVPAPVLLAILIPFAGLAIVLALCRRDGLPMDAWLLAALRHAGAPKHVVPAPGPAPAWAPTPDRASPPTRLLRLPVNAITGSGTIDTGDRTVAVVACSTINIALRSGTEQAALLGGYGQWLNSLTGPAQIVVSSRRVELAGRAARVLRTADALPNPALADAARDYAAFLGDLADRCDPLWRTVTVSVTSDVGIVGPAGRTQALRRADHTAAALAVLGAQTAVLDGERVTAVLACATDPYTPADVTWPRARPDTTITGRSSW